MRTLKRRPIVDTSDSGCLHRNIAEAAMVFRDGTKQVATWCFDCGKRSSWYSKKELLSADIDIESLEVVRDNSGEGRFAEPCEVCGETEGTEHHHFAPVSLQDHFTESVWDWPMAWLCRRCHAEWHRAVTPDLVHHSITLHVLGAKRSMTLRQLLDRVRDRLNDKESAA